MGLIAPGRAYRLHTIALLLIAIGLPLSRFLMSVGGILLALEWAFGGHLGQRLRKASSDPAVISLLALYAIHLFGLLYSSELDRALQDLRIKLPLLIFPLAMGGRKDDVPFRPVLLAFFIAFFLSSSISSLAWMDRMELPWKTGDDPTLFISAIRLSLIGCMSFFFALFWMKESKEPRTKILLGAFSAWTLFYLALLATGISMLVMLVLFLYVLDLWRRRVSHSIPMLLIIASLLLPALYLGWETNDFYHVAESPLNEKQELPERTDEGNPYQHHPGKEALENGYYVHLFVCRPELEKAWNSRSDIPFEGKDREGNLLETTLIRYMSSKGLKKDAEGMQKMSEADIERVENGVANIALHRMNPVRKRVRKVLFELDQYVRGQDPSGNSVTQRFEYWRAGFWIVQENPWTGVGTGDLKKAFDRAYEAIDTKLEEEHRHRAHQQFLTSWIAWGPLGFLVLMGALFIPALRKGGFRDPYYTVFFLTLFLSFLTEDTLETQAGVTLFAFWNCFLLFRKGADPRKDPQKERSS